MITQIFAVPLRILIVAATLPTPPAQGAIAPGTSTPPGVIRDAGSDQRLAPAASILPALPALPATDRRVARETSMWSRP